MGANVSQSPFSWMHTTAVCRVSSFRLTVIHALIALGPLV